MDERCRNCKHFDPGATLANGQREGWGSCERSETDEVSPVRNADSLALAYATGWSKDGHWDGFLYVSPDFGCVQFEADEA